jgi:hypothetical protein
VRRFTAAFLFLFGLGYAAFGSLWFGLAQIVLSVGIVAMEAREKRQAAREEMKEFD